MCFSLADIKRSSPRTLVLAPTSSDSSSKSLVFRQESEQRPHVVVVEYVSTDELELGSSKYVRWTGHVAGVLGLVGGGGSREAGSSPVKETFLVLATGTTSVGSVRPATGYVQSALDSRFWSCSTLTSVFLNDPQHLTPRTCLQAPLRFLSFSHVVNMGCRPNSRISGRLRKRLRRDSLVPVLRPGLASDGALPSPARRDEKDSRGGVVLLCRSGVVGPELEVGGAVAEGRAGRGWGQSGGDGRAGVRRGQAVRLEPVHLGRTERLQRQAGGGGSGRAG